MGVKQLYRLWGKKGTLKQLLQTHYIYTTVRYVWLLDILLQLI